MGRRKLEYRRFMVHFELREEVSEEWALVEALEKLVKREQASQYLRSIALLGHALRTAVKTQDQPANPISLATVANEKAGIVANDILGPRYEAIDE